jgi:hypothetical protein
MYNVMQTTARMRKFSDQEMSGGFGDSEEEEES